MGDSQEQAKEKSIFDSEPPAATASAPPPSAEAPPVEPEREALPPPPGTIARMLLIWQVALLALLAIAAVNTAASLYHSTQSRWPTTPESVIVKTETVIGKINSYLLGLRYHLSHVFTPDSDQEPRRLGVHDRLILALAILALIVRLLMEIKVMADAMSAEPLRWAGARLYAFQLIAGVLLTGLLAWLGAAAKGNEQMPLLWLFVAYLAAHGAWMTLSFIALGGRASVGGVREGTGKFLMLGVNSLVFAAILAVGSFYATQFRDEIKIATAASLVCLAGSVIGVRIVADPFFGGARLRAGVRHAAFIGICLGLLALIAVTILARRT